MVNYQSIKNYYSQALELISVLRYLKNMLTDGATLFHLVVKVLFRSFITLNCRVSLKYHFEFTDNIMWVKVLKPLLKLLFQTIQDSTLNRGVLILPSMNNI